MLKQRRRQSPSSCSPHWLPFTMAARSIQNSPLFTEAIQRLLAVIVIGGREPGIEFGMHVP